MAKRAGRSRTRLLALEPRVLFDGALADTSAAVPKLGAADAAFDLSRVTGFAVPAAVDSPAPSPAAVEWLVVDSRVPDAAQLIANARPGMQVLLLDPERDGLQQINQALAKAGGPVSALHIVSHGAAGYIALGSTALDQTGLEQRAADLISLQQWLSSDADVMLYGCDVAATATGEAFVRELAQLTGADVTASRDATGGSVVKGNWTLEFATGQIGVSPFLSSVDGDSYGARLSTSTWPATRAGSPSCMAAPRTRKATAKPKLRILTSCRPYTRLALRRLRRRRDGLRDRRLHRVPRAH